ncbi:MAG TPA: MlaD family protein [Chitinophagaceae bacterium]
MRKKSVNNVKLGIFILAGLLFLMLMLYMIGRDQNLFASTFTIKTRFENIQGLVPGNNVRYAGIEVGTVKKIVILNDTLIEVVMILDDEMKSYIKSNAITSIGTDGLMGNKVVNIAPAHAPAPFVQEGDILPARKVLDTDAMLRTLDKTNADVAVIAENLKTTILKLNNSTALWNLLNDNTLPLELRQSAANVRAATAKAVYMANDLQSIVKDVKEGKGSLGAILTDTSFAANLNETIAKINKVGDHADELATAINGMVSEVRQDVNSGKGPANALLKDSAMVLKLNTSLDNIQKGTDAFQQNMEALKHNFLFRGYFRKLEKQKEKENKSRVVSQ